VARFRIGIVAMPRAVQGPPPAPLLEAPLHPNPDDVVIGIIDHGIAFANKEFASVDLQGQWHSRIERIWDQQWGYPVPPGQLPPSLNASPAQSSYASNFWETVPHYGYGRQLTNDSVKAQIDFWLNQGFTEEALYRHLNYPPVQRDRAHGTHVLGMAAGQHAYGFGGRPGSPVGQHNDPASRASIIAVQLPALPYKDTSGTGLCVQILDAVSYIALHAAGRRVVINLSDGAYAGPHDGSSLLERALDGFFVPGHSRRAFVVAAGNQFDERVHWKDAVPPGNGESVLSWRTLPDDNSDSHLEIWPAENGPAVDLEVSVTAPGQAPTPFVSLGNSWALTDPASPGSRARAAVIFSKDPPNAASAGGTRAMVHIAVAASRPARGSQATIAPHGVWRVVLRNKGAAAIDYAAYIERDNPALGDVGPRRQSHFVHPQYPRACTTMTPPLDDAGNASPIRRMGSLNNVASARSVLVVGGFVHQTSQLASYSASGPGRNAAGNVGVDVIATTDGSAVVRGVRGPAVRTGTTFRMDGTSVAAPQVTRWIANWMATSPASAVDWAAVLGPSVSTKNPTLNGPPDRTGLGRLK
jgi:hypothetical protein